MPSNNMNWNPGIPQSAMPAYPAPPPAPSRPQENRPAARPPGVPFGVQLVTPPQENFNSESMRGSMQQILSDNLGEFVVCEFIIGTQGLTHKEGILYSVGRNYITLYDDAYHRYVICDIFSIKFVTFYDPGQRPPSSERGTTVTPVR